MKHKLLILCFSFITLTTYLEAQPRFIPKAVWANPYPFVSFFGARKFLHDRGIDFFPFFILEANWPAMGGVKTVDHPIFNYYFMLQAGLLTEELCHWKGGHFVASFQYHGGVTNPEQKYTGDYLGFDNLTSPPLTQLSELWYNQSFFKDQVGATFGKMDLWTVFGYIEYASFYVNNAFSQLPTILGFPSYPNQSVGTLLRYSPSYFVILRTAIFDGSNATGVRTGAMGPKGFFVNLGQHALIFGQVDLRWDHEEANMPGYAQLGFWGLTTRLPNFSGGTIKGAAGPYAILNQSLWREKQPEKVYAKNQAPKDIGFFAQFGITNQEVLKGYAYVGGGLTFNNFAKNTKAVSDNLGIGIANVFFSKAKGNAQVYSYEMALEATYQVYFFDFFGVQPDIQYIIHPSGANYRNVLVVTLRLSTNI